MRKTGFLLLMILALPHWMCKKDNACDCFKSTGEVTMEVRQLPEFHNVYVEDNVNLIFQEDTVQRITVQAGKHLLKNIKTEMDGDMLVIKNMNTCNFVRRYDIPINIYIHYVRNQFFQIRTKGTGTITNSNACTSDSIDLNSESSGDITFQVGGNSKILTHQHGAGDITVSGSCNQMVVFSKGTGFTITEDCPSNYAYVYTNTTGKITLGTTLQILCYIDGSGNVYYKGNPPLIEKHETSTGQLLPY